MPTTLTSTGITFPDGTNTRSDVGRIVTKATLDAMDVTDNITTGRIWGTPYPGGYTCWSSANAAINVRGRMYNTVYTSAIGFDGKSYTLGTGAYIRSTTKTITNSSGNTLRVTVTAGLYDWTDDTTRWVVYEDGTVTNSYTHSGGTLILDSGSAARTGTFYGSVTLATNSTTRDIAPGATVSWTFYGGVMSGSNYDGVSPYFSVAFNAWV